MAQIWGTQDKLSQAQVEKYLHRIGLDVQATLARPADRTLLADVQVAHILHVPFDLTPIHLPNKVSGDNDQFDMRRGPGMPMDLQSGFANVVSRNRGGYCFVLNGLFAALLRALGFRVSELTARVYLLRNKDPAEAGWLWSSTTHVRRVTTDYELKRYWLMLLDKPSDGLDS